MKLVIVIIIILWIVSYVKFRRNYKIHKLLVVFTRELYNQSPSPYTAIEHASALMLAQQYKSALEIFEHYQGPNATIAFPFLNDNIAFCKKPLPWTQGARDHINGSWWHNFLLVRLGGRRQVAISNKTALAFNAFLRSLS